MGNNPKFWWLCIKIIFFKKLSWHQNKLLYTHTFFGSKSIFGFIYILMKEEHLCFIFKKVKMGQRGGGK